MESISQINKSARKAKKIPSKLILNLGNLADMKFVAYCDASFGALAGGGSQGGYIIFLVGSNDNYLPIAWQSHRLKRVVKSSHAAETLAMVDMMEACIYYRKFLLELLHLKDSPLNIPITCKTDNSALHEFS